MASGFRELEKEKKEEEGRNSRLNILVIQIIHIIVSIIIHQETPIFFSVNHVGSEK